jgi:Ternary complex associated domain 7
VPASVDTNIVIADAAAPVREAHALIEQTSPSYIVVRRHQGESLHYAFRPEEILASASKQPDRLLIDALGLHEWQRSPERSVNAVTFVPDTGGPPSTHRSVVLIDDTPIGVVPEAARRPMSWSWPAPRRRSAASRSAWRHDVPCPRSPGTRARRLASRFPAGVSGVGGDLPRTRAKPQRLRRRHRRPTSSASSVTCSPRWNPR